MFSLEIIWLDNDFAEDSPLNHYHFKEETMKKLVLF